MQQVKETMNIPDIRSQFPILGKTVNGEPLVYLDNAATSQKPRIVINAIRKFYENDNANVKRGMHKLAERSTELYEMARAAVASFINATSDLEVVFTKNTTESINAVAKTWCKSHLGHGDTVLLSILEHHSNIVPWMQLKEETGIALEWVGINGDGTLNMPELEQKLQNSNIRFAAITCVSNVLGTITPYAEITQLAHRCGAKILLDAAQLAPRRRIDVQKIGCDFLVFSGHKTYGPTGIGVLYGRKELLNEMPPFLGGGSMIQEVTTDGFSETHLPDKLEAGTPPIAQAHGLGVALNWLDSIGWGNIRQHEQQLMEYASRKLRGIPFVKILNDEPAERVGCISFVTPPVHPHDLTEYLGHKGICLRAGHHCAQPLHRDLGHPASTRMSIAIYNTKDDVDRMCETILEAYKFFIGT